MANKSLDLEANRRHLDSLGRVRLASKRYEMLGETLATGSTAQGRFQLQRKESAQRRLQQALKIHQLAADITLKQQPGPPLRLVC